MSGQTPLSAATVMGTTGDDTSRREKAILETIPDAAWFIDSAGRFLAVNAAFCNFFRVEAGNVLGKTGFEFLPLAVAQRFANHDRSIIESRQPLRLEVALSDKEGRPVWFETIMSPLYDDAGNVVGVAGLARDITGRKRTEEKLRESEERYRSLFTNMTEGFALHEILCDAQGEPCDYRFLDVNPTFERLTGLKREDVLGKTLRQIMPEEAAFWVRRYGAVALTGQPARFESYSAALARHYEVSAYRPAPGQFATLFQDITERKRAEEEKLAMERRLLHAQKLESLGILAGGVAHDFNNILSGIMGYADLAKTRLPHSEPAREDMDVIKKAAQRAADLTRQMLAYSGKGKFVVEPVNLSQIVEEARKMLAVSVSKKAVLNFHLTADLPAIEADASQIHQVLLNLVLNASEALSDGCGAVSITTDSVRLTRADCAAISGGGELGEGLYVRLEVADTGCGMDQATLARIFDPFFSTKFTGRGLGLAAVHGIMRGHNGAVQVFSTPGKGTSFRVLFPAGEPAATASQPETAAAAWRGSGTVLVVDDHELVRNLAQRMIEHLGFSVLAAADGEEAVRLYSQHHHDIACVLLDLTMPGMGGEETFRELRKIRPDVRVVLSSGYSQEGAMGRFTGQGLAGFLQKPYHLETMKARLHEICGER